MNHRYIGRTGLRVSDICLGTMTFGTTTSKEEAFEILDMAYDKGINFLDTAEIYPVPPTAKLGGLTEEIVGQWLKTKPRDSVILATKVSGAANGWFIPPTRHGLTAIDSFHIKTAIEGSLKRLQTDYVDLYQMHWPDTIVPIEESLKAFDALVKEGKVRYVGTSNDTAYGLAKANETSKHLGISRFESIQNNFSLLNPRFLDELSTVCKKEQISLLPYSPIAGGVLSGKYNNEFIAQDIRFALYAQDQSPRSLAMVKRFVNDKTLEATKNYLSISKKYGVSPVTLAVAYSKHFDFVASTIIGARKKEQLADIFAAIDYKVSNELLNEIKEVQQEIMYPLG